MSKPKYLKPVTQKTLKAGKYIRCVVNYRGHYWYEIVDVFGKPYYDKKCHNHGWKVCAGSNKSKFGGWMYVDDLMNVRLFKFSHKVIAEIKKHEQDQFTFAEFIHGVKYTNKEKATILRQQEFEAQLDDEMFDSWTNFYASDTKIEALVKIVNQTPRIEVSPVDFSKGV